MEIFLLISAFLLTLGVLISLGIIGRQVFRSAWIDSRSLPVFWGMLFLLLLLLVMSWVAVFFYFDLI